MALRPQRTSTAGESRRAAAAMPARKETGMKKKGGGQAARVRGWWERMLMAQRRYIGPQTRRPVRNVQQQQPASGRADQRQLAPSTRREEAARGRRRGTDLVEVNCTEAGAAGTGRGRRAESDHRRLDRRLGRCVCQSEHQLRDHSADAGAEAIGRPDGVRGEDAHLGCTRRAVYGAGGSDRWLCVRRERVLQAKAEGQRQRCRPEKRRA